MKKAATVILLFVYLALTAGLIVHVRFCNGDIKAMQIGENKTNCCDNKCTQQYSCCKEERLFVLLDIDQNRTYSSISIDPVVSNLLLIFGQQLFDFKAVENSTKQFYADLSPPKKQPLWLMHCTFTYYG